VKHQSWLFWTGKSERDSEEGEQTHIRRKRRGELLVFESLPVDGLEPRVSSEFVGTFACFIGKTLRGVSLQKLGGMSGWGRRGGSDSRS
jgi:hypothetical protein